MHEGLYGVLLCTAGDGVPRAGRLRMPLRLKISMQDRKHAFTESDKGVVECWSETPTWQYCNGLDNFERRWPGDPSILPRRSRKIHIPPSLTMAGHAGASRRSNIWHCGWPLPRYPSTQRRPSRASTSAAIPPRAIARSGQRMLEPASYSTECSASPSLPFSQRRCMP